ncbi:MAG TPA: EamA family transporter [Dongiaceae bacterium]|nr:EamA family transporter [Dongiaceae bacterium]
MLGANLGLLLTMFAWGSMIPAVNIMVQTWDPYFLTAARYIAAAPILLLLLALVEPGRRGGPSVASWRLWLLGTVGIGIFSPLFILGIAHSNPVTAAVLAAAGPVITAIVAWLSFRVPMERGLVPAILFAVVGGLLATYDPNVVGAPFDLRGGEVLILLASACWAWYSLAAQRWLAGWSQLRITTMTMSCGGVVAVIVFLLFGAFGVAPLPPTIPLSAQDLGLFTWMTLGPVIMGFFLWNYGVRKLGILVASLFLNLTPVAAILITAALGTYPTATQILDATLVVAGVLQSQLRYRLPWGRNGRSTATSRER